MTGSAGERVDERTLSNVWRSQWLDPGSLRSVDGVALEVVYRGRPSRAPGPDFRRAAIAFDGDLRHGDVEVHVATGDWLAHRHHRDRRYDDVILHVVHRWEPERPVRTSKGADVPCLVLPEGGADEHSSGDSARPGADGCRARVDAHSTDDLGRRLDRLGDERLERKADLLSAELDAADPEQVCHERLMETLGYSQNRRPFLELARRLPLASLYSLAHRRAPAERVALCESLLFGVAGLLPSQGRAVPELDWVSAQHVEELEEAWAAYGGDWRPEVMGDGCWEMGVRPLNSPARRIAAMGHLLGAHLQRGLVEAIGDALGEAGGAEAVRRLLDVLSIDAPDSYWASYYDFGRPLGPRVARLLGRQRALEAVVNVALPLAIASSRDGVLPSRAGDAARATYAALPKQAANEVTRWMLDEVVGRSRARVVSSARRQQALHHLYQTACDQLRCDACPLES